MSQEKLIEEAVRRYPDNTHTKTTPLYAQMKREAFIAGAVFEKALGEATVTPTDDERETLDQIVREHDGWWPETRDAILAQYVRRSEVPEPSAEGWSTEDRREALAEGLRRWSVQGQHDRVEQRDHDLYGMGARQGFALGAEWWKASHPGSAPQGEPSDARHAEHVTVEWAYESDCLEGECAHRDEDGEPEDMSVCPTVPPFEVCVGCMEDEGRGIDPEQWDDVPLMSWPCPAALRAANEVENR